MTVILVTADEAFANWPTLDEAVACANCEGVFRQSENLKCPHCGSESLFDPFRQTDGHVGQQLLTMLAKLDEVLNG